MGIKGKYSINDFFNAANRQFTDRVGYIEAFEKAIISKNENHKILVYYGLGGIGKSSLRKKLVEVFEEGYTNSKWAYVDFTTEKYRNLEESLLQLRYNLREKYNLSFPTFDLAYTIYWNKAHPNVPIKQEGFPLLNGGGIMSDIITAAGDIPLVGLATNLITIAIKSQKHIANELIKYKTNLMMLEDMETNEVLERLSLFFSEDIKNNLKQNPSKMVIFLDTYEALWTNKMDAGLTLTIDEWVRDVISYLPEVLWVICGREKLRWGEIEPEWDTYLEQHLLEPLAATDAEDFLINCKISEDDIRKIIIKSSDGVPLNLDLCVDTYYQIRKNHDRMPLPEDFSSTKREIFECFLKYLDRNQKATLLIMSIPRLWDKNLFQELVMEFKTFYPITEFNEFCMFSFVNPINNQKDIWSIHDFVRKTLHSYQSTDVFIEVNKFMFDYYNKKLDKLSIKNASTLAADIQEAFYHGGFILDVKALYLWFAEKADILATAAQWSKLIPMYEYIVENMKEHISDYKEEYISVLNSLSSAYLNRSKLDKAHQLIVEAHNTLASSSDTLIAADTYNNMGRIFYELGRFEDSRVNYEEAYRIRLKLLGEDHIDLLNVMNSLYTLYLTKFNKKISPEIYKKLVDKSEKIYGCENSNTMKYINNLGVYYIEAKKYDKAEETLLKALRLYKKHYPEKHPSIARTLSNLGGLYKQTERYEKSEEHYKEALDMRIEILGENHIETTYSLMKLAYLYETTKSYEHVEELLRRSLNLRRNILGEDNLKTAICYNNLGHIYKKMKRYDEAELMFNNELKIKLKILAIEDPKMNIPYNALIGLYKTIGADEKLENLLIKRLELACDSLDVFKDGTITSFNKLLEYYLEKSNFEKAENLLLERLDMVMAKEERKDSKYIQDTYKKLYNLYTKFGYNEKADDIQTRFVKIDSSISNHNHSSDKPVGNFEKKLQEELEYEERVRQRIRALLSISQEKEEHQKNKKETDV